jgi:hypothetical protein
MLSKWLPLRVRDVAVGTPAAATSSLAAAATAGGSPPSAAAADGDFQLQVGAAAASDQPRSPSHSLLTFELHSETSVGGSCEGAVLPCMFSAALPVAHKVSFGFHPQ